MSKYSHLMQHESTGVQNVPETDHKQTQTYLNDREERQAKEHESAVQLNNSITAHLVVQQFDKVLRQQRKKSIFDKLST